MKVRVINDSLDHIAKKVYANNKDATSWDVIVAYLSEKGNIEPSILWILSDLQILLMIARGYEAGYIAQSLDVLYSDIRKTARVWGMSCMDSTLDFNPLTIYEPGMMAQDLRFKLEDILITVPETSILEKCISNVEQYLSVKDLLEKWEE